MTKQLLDELAWRGLISQTTDRAALAEHLDGGSRTLYCGFDPTADSLHIGSLVPLWTLRRFQLAGHRPILLLGGATGLIGDPSFRDDERTLNDSGLVADWVEALHRQVQPFLDFSGEHGALIVNNLDWTRQLDVVSFLRDIGKHFSINAMIQRESVKARLERPDQGISYTEFSYMLLQGMDFLELARQYDCYLQIGGSDQWGNIISGADLIRRHMAREAYAMTLPLVTKADGSKFGKTASGTVWIDGAKTSPYAFYQFWVNAADADVLSFLNYFTFLERETIDALAASTAEHPERREAQLRLAREVTALVHGADAVASAERITAALFAGELNALTEDDFAQLRLDGISSSECAPGAGLLTAMVDGGLAKSTSEARKLVQGGGVRVNGEPVSDAQMTLDFSRGFYGQFLMLQRGKKRHHLLFRAA